ncbi:hypothetical protein IU402_08570 [Aerococcaceae bacterium zg-BR9]|uniref:MSCRAMM family protein n=1 Tax=Aerococcaceae bacterium zg-1292 TaxID=2774330 RepID=UPI004063203C|nr:hypothetical protein [Aerococcaceae bacterium zg-BR9]
MSRNKFYCLLSLLMMTLIAPFSVVQAQEAKVHYNVQVKSNLPDGSVQNRTDISYDIIDKATNKVVWSYRNGTGSTNSLVLPEGEYLFRLYHWDQISQGGTVVADELVESVINPTSTEHPKSEQYRLTEYPGEPVTLGDGSIVYDIPFSVKATDDLLNKISLQYESNFFLFLADPETAKQTNFNEEAPQEAETTEAQTEEEAETTEPAETEAPTTEAPPAETEEPATEGALHLQVKDEAGKPVQGATFDFQGQQVTTDAEGKAALEHLAPGQGTLTLLSLPEGYQGEYSEAVDIQAGQIKALEFTVTKAAETQPATQTLTLNVTDEHGNPLPNVGLSIDGVERVTNEKGQIIMEGMPLGNYHYEVVSVPNGYELGQQGDFTLTADNPNPTVNVAVRQTKKVGTLSFYAVDENGKPLEGVGITVAGQEIFTAADGKVSVQQLDLGEHPYQVTSVPEGYQAPDNGVVTLSEPDETKETKLVFAKPTPKAAVTVTVVDQHQQPVAHAKGLIDETISFETDDKGQAVISDLTVGKHTMRVTEWPKGYKGDTAEQTVELSAEGTTVAVTAEKEAPRQTIQLKVVDQLGKAVSNAKVALHGQEKTTNDNGVAEFTDIPVGEAHYDIAQLPEKFEAQYTGDFKVVEGQKEYTLTLNRTVTPGSATLTIVNQHQQPVANVKVKFGGLTGISNAEGKVTFNNLELGNYYYAITEAPKKAEFSSEEKRAEITEGLAFEDTLTVKEQAAGKVKFTAKDAQGKPLKDITVAMNQQHYTTDENGNIVVEGLEAGTYDYEITGANGYQFNQNKGSVAIQPDTLTQVDLISAKPQETTTTTQATTTAAATTTQTSETTAVTTNGSYRQFLDATTNIEVWVHQQDADKVKQLKVEKVKVDSLSNKDADIYAIQLLDAQGQVVALTQAAQFKIPTRLVNSQLQLVKIDGSQATTVAHTVHNRRVNFTTNQTGTYAVIYGDKTAVTVAKETTTTTQSQTLKVETSTGIERRIPATGERKSFVYIIGIIALVLGAIFILRDKKGKH